MLKYYCRYFWVDIHTPKGSGDIMARKTIEKNIAYDDVKNLYYATFDYGKDSTGKRVKPVKTFDSRKEAKKALKEFEANKTKQTLVFPTVLTVEGWLKYWLDDIKTIQCEETTIYGYKNIINNHLIPAFPDVKIQDLSYEKLNKYFISKKDSGLSNSTIRKHYDLLKDALKHAVDEDKILKNPLHKIKPIKKTNQDITVYNLEQLKTLYSIVQGNRMEIVIKLAGMLGLRRSEIAGLKWDSVDFENTQISISKVRTQAGKNTITKGTKNRSSHRTLSIPPEIIELLTKIKTIQDENKKILGSGYIDNEYVMSWENGEAYRPNYISDLFKKIIDDNKLPSLKLHDLRHTFSSIANDLGISIHDISKALGHSDIGTTSKIYTHIFDKTHKKAINKLADAMTAK
jgi:integrase